MNVIVKLTLLALVGGMFAAADFAGAQQHVAQGGVVGTWGLISETARQGANTAPASRPVAVCTTEQLEDLFTLAKQQDRTEDMDALGVVANLVYEDATLRQYVKFTFGTVVFIQSKWRKNGKGLDEIDRWIVIAGADGHLVSASHDQIVEDNATVVTWKNLPNGDKEAVSVARGIIDRFLGRLIAI